MNVQVVRVQKAGPSLHPLYCSNSRVLKILHLATLKAKVKTKTLHLKRKLKETQITRGFHQLLMPTFIARNRVASTALRVEVDTDSSRREKRWEEVEEETIENLVHPQKVQQERMTDLMAKYHLICILTSVLMVHNAQDLRVKVCSTSC